MIDPGKTIQTALEFHQKGQIKQAETLYRRVLKQEPGNADGWHLLGLLAFQTGKNREALRLMRKAITLDGTQAHFFNNIGEVYRAMGELEKARLHYEQALALNGSYAEAHNNLGSVFQQSEQWEEAIACHQRAIKLKPDHFSAVYNLGTVMMKAGRFAEAIPLLEQAIGLDPTVVEAHNNLGCSWRELGRPAQAVACLRKALEVAPGHPPAHYNLGNALREAGRSADAVHAFRKAIRLQPDFQGAHNNLAGVLKERGRMAEAVMHYEKALAISPNDHEVRRNLAQCRKFDPSNQGEITQVAGFLAEPGLSDDDRISLHFTLGKMADDCGDYDRSFHHYQEANRLKCRQVRFDREAHRGFIDRMMAVFSGDFLASHSGFGMDDQRLVFIVGMPRSATTLVEQILSSHPAAFGADELSKLSALAQGLPERMGLEQGSFPECLAELDGETAQEVAREYRDFLLAVSGKGYERISDKMPYNFLYLGFIALLFPRARIIHCRRDPLDTSLSIFFQYFTVPGRTNDFAYDLDDIGFYYRHYRRIMDHWRRTLPIAMLEVDYEVLVADREGQIRALIDFLGLPWDDRCLQPHRTRRTVRTASNWQVRQPIHAGSVHRYRYYERHLDPLKAALAKVEE